MIIPMYSRTASRSTRCWKAAKVGMELYQDAVYRRGAVGAGGSLHPAVDDSGWSALGTCAFTRRPRTKRAPACRAMTDNAIARWRDGELGGGLWYNNERQFKSIYQCGVLMSLEHWEIRKTDTAKKNSLIFTIDRKTLRRTMAFTG